MKSIFESLIESFLIEAAALTKGSQRVMGDKKLVSGLADALRDDAMSNPGSFPTGSNRTFQKSNDEVLAQWFLENIDQIEREGYEGQVYSRDGVNSDWIARRYIAGSHNWEDLTGVMNMNLRDWYLLKNRDMLDQNHKDLPKFNGVRDVGRYMTVHYKDKLEDVRVAAKNAARAKMSKSIKLVDNENYRIYTTLNRAAGCALGLGTQWCTANSNADSHYHRYSDAAMLFQMFPYSGKKDSNGKPILSDTVKYQFDAGGYNFMDINDHRAHPEFIQAAYPFIFTDLSKALEQNKSKMEKAFAELSIDPTLQEKDFKIKTYEIDEEIKKLHGFVTRGYFTNESRSAKQPDEPQVADQPQPTQGQIAMENKSFKSYITELEITEDVELGQIVQHYKPLGQDQAGEESPLTFSDDLEEDEYDDMDAGHDFENDAPIAQQNYNDEMSQVSPEDAMEMIGKIMYMQDMGLSKGNHAYSEEELAQLNSSQLKKVQNEVMGTVSEDDAMQGMDAGGMDAGGDMSGQAATGGSLGGGGGGGGGKYPPGTAPTMPESIQENEEHEQNKDAAQKEMDKRSSEGEDMSNYEIDKKTYAIKKKENTMENVDKDVAAMMASLKKYDKLNESVLGMVTLSMAKPKVVEAGTDKSQVPAAFRKEKGGDWKTSQSDLDKEENKSPTTKKGLEDLKDKKDIKESNEVDPEVLEWMSRFSKLGNMKGYGR